jgi:large subunit ribosomal protein L5
MAKKKSEETKPAKETAAEAAPKAKPAKAGAPKAGAAAGAAKAAAPKPAAGGEPQGERPAGPRYSPRLRQRYRDEVVPKLMQEFGITNPMAVPRLEKISLNMGLGEASRNIKVLDDAILEMQALAGQKPTMTRAKKSIAQFKLREGMPIGARVTLRGDRMWDFLDRLISIALPRVRDFRGVPRKSFDGRGNYTLGVKDQLIFPEIDYNKVESTKGMNITITTTAGNDERALFLLRELGMPFVGR